MDKAELVISKSTVNAFTSHDLFTTVDSQLDLTPTIVRPISSSVIRVVSIRFSMDKKLKPLTPPPPNRDA